MSYHSELHGIALFDTRSTLNELLSGLNDLGYITEEELNDAYGRFSIGRVQKDGEEYYSFTIPRNHYRNLGRHTDMILDNAVEGIVVGTSNDVKWHGFVARPNEEKETDLRNWVDNQANADPEPVESDYESFGEWAQAHSQWQLTYENQYIRTQIEQSGYTEFLL